MGWESGVRVGEVDGDDVIISEVMGKFICAGFSLSTDTESVRPLRSNV